MKIKLKVDILVDLFGWMLKFVDVGKEIGVIFKMLIKKELFLLLFFKEMVDVIMLYK